MKKIFFLTVVYCSLLISCKNNSDGKKLSYDGKILTEQLTQREFDYSKAKEELNRERTDSRIPFTMNFYGCLGKPVLKVEGNNDVYVMLDSGSTRNWFYYSLLEKINVTEDNFIQKVVEYIKQNELELIKNHSSEKEVAQYLKNEWSNYNLNYLASVSFGDISLRYDPNVSETFDGVIGAEFLLNYDRVTIDFINQYIILNDEKLDGAALKMYQSPNDEFDIYFEYRGQPEFGMIDTGNYGFTPRHNFGDRNQQYDINDYSNYGYGYKDKVPITPRVMYSYNDIKIGEIIYNNMNGAYSTIKGSGFNKGAQSHMMKLNGLGNVFFYNHIIQFDFVDMQFIIK